MIGRRRHTPKHHYRTEAAMHIDANMRDHAAAGDRAFEAALEAWKARQRGEADPHGSVAPSA